MVNPIDAKVGGLQSLPLEVNGTKRRRGYAGVASYCDPSATPDLKS
jgi:hypothetical protein